MKNYWLSRKKERETQQVKVTWGHLPCCTVTVTVHSPSPLYISDKIEPWMHSAISFDKPEVIQMSGKENVPDIVFAVPAINIDPSSILEMPAYIPSPIYISDKIEFPSMIQFGNVNLPSMIGFGPAPEMTKITFDTPEIPPLTGI